MNTSIRGKLALHIVGALLSVTSPTFAQAPVESIPPPAPGSQPAGSQPDPDSQPDPSAIEPATDVPSQIATAKSPWRVELTPYIWLMGVEGDIGVRALTANVSASFLDIVEESDSVVGFGGRLEVGYEKFGLYLDGFYAKLGIDDASGPGGPATVDIKFNQTILDFGVMYRLGDWEPSGDAAKNGRNLTLDLYAGGRYSGVDVTLSPTVLAERSDSKDWVDPILGAKLVAPIAEHWHFEINGDVGGFGAASEFTWSATAAIGYDFHIGNLPASVLLGYRAVGWDYTNGSGSDKFTWDLVEHGVTLGFLLKF